MNTTRFDKANIQSINDRSDYLVHLAGSESPYETLLSILSSRTIRGFKKFGLNRAKQEHNSICFSEIPPKFLKKLTDRHGTHGIAFSRKFLEDRGANRVWYVNNESHLMRELRELIVNGRPSSAVNSIMPFIDSVGLHDYVRYEFDWEREWRLLGDLFFDVEDVAFLILPSEHHEAARDFFHCAMLDNTGPNYNCTYYDPKRDFLSTPT